MNMKWKISKEIMTIITIPLLLLTRMAMAISIDDNKGLVKNPFDVWGSLSTGLKDLTSTLLGMVFLVFIIIVIGGVLVAAAIGILGRIRKNVDQRNDGIEGVVTVIAIAVIAFIGIGTFWFFLNLGTTVPK